MFSLKDADHIVERKSGGIDSLSWVVRSARVVFEVKSWIAGMERYLWSISGGFAVSMSDV